MNKLLLALAFAAGLSVTAQVPSARAQNASVVATCGSVTLPPGYGNAPVTQDVTGLLCTSGGGGGGGGGTSSNFGNPFPTTGTAVGFLDSTGTVMEAGNLDASGNIKVNIAAGSASNAAAGTTGAAVPGSASYTGFNSAGNLVGVSSGNPFPISGPVTQSGTWNINNVSGTVSLPTGAATAAKQPALGTAGSSSADVLSVQGISGGTALPASQSGTWNINAITTLPALPSGTNVIGRVGIDQTTPGTTNLVAAGQSGTWNINNVAGTVSLPTGASTAANQAATQGSVSGGTAATTSTLAGGQYRTSPPSLTNTQQSALQLDSSGNLKVNITAGGGAGGTSSNFSSAFPTAGTAAGFLDSTATNMVPANLDASGFLKVNVAAGSAGNGAASNTGAAVPAQASYTGFNSGGNLVGVSSGNPLPITGTVTAANPSVGTIGATAPTSGTLIGATQGGNIVSLTSASGRLVVDGSAVTQPVSGTFWQATQPVSGTVAATQSGTWNINAITTLPALPANQSVNMAQVAGTTTAVGNGTANSGTQRVTLSSDSTGQVVLAAGSATIGALTANQSVNNTQINGVALSAGNGASGTGVQRVTIANDSTGTVGLNAGSNTIGTVNGPTTPGSAVTGGGTRITGSDGTNARDVSVSTTGVLDSPRAGTSNRVVTKTNISSNTSTQVCPTASAPIATEMYFTTGGVGISLSGGTLTTATIGTTAGTQPDLSFASANTMYTFPVPPTNAITAYGAAGIVVCIQTIRQ